MDRRLAIVGPPPPPKDKRPLCVGCGCIRQPYFYWEHEKDENGKDILMSVIGKRWHGYYEGYGNFHSMRCAVKWANTLLNVPRDKRDLMQLIKDGRS